METHHASHNILQQPRIVHYNPKEHLQLQKK
jgi:hypothetical protein